MLSRRRVRHTAIFQWAAQGSATLRAKLRTRKRRLLNQSSAAGITELRSPDVHVRYQRNEWNHDGNDRKWKSSDSSEADKQGACKAHVPREILALERDVPVHVKEPKASRAEQYPNAEENKKCPLSHRRHATDVFIASSSRPNVSVTNEAFSGFVGLRVLFAQRNRLIVKTPGSADAAIIRLSRSG
jgi:hypothetical protein